MKYECTTLHQYMFVLVFMFNGSTNNGVQLRNWLLMHLYSLQTRDQ